MQPHHLRQIRDVLAAARAAAKSGHFDGCDLDDLDEVMTLAEREMEAARPNQQTLATYLNSLARSLRSQPRADDVVQQIDDALRAAGLLRDWRP